MRLERSETVLCPIAVSFLATWEADLAAGDRLRLIEPLREKLPLARTGGDTAAWRAAAASDWLLRTCAPLWVEVANPPSREGQPAYAPALRSCLPIRVEAADPRTRRLTMDRAITKILAARMAVGHAAWSATRPELGAHRGAVERIVGHVLPGAIEQAEGPSGIRAAMHAASLSPFTMRWPALRDHVRGIVIATTTAMAWEAAWKCEIDGHEDAWVETSRATVARRLTPIVSRLQLFSVALARQMLAR